jgi:cobalamin biosynthesis Mg chelatase CobN
MAWNRIQAARLLSHQELTLFEASLADRAPRMSDRELQAQIRRVRAQRDKFQDLLRRQRVASRERTGSKSGRSGVANARTDQKVQVFSEALERLEKQQDRRERIARRSEGKPSGSAGRTTVRSAVKAALRRPERATGGRAGKPRNARSSKAPAKGPAGGSAASPDGQGGPALPHAKRMQAAGQQRPLAHVAARGRRQQAKRDLR